MGKFSNPDSSGAGGAGSASNVNVGGVGVFKQKSGSDLQFRGINGASSKVTVSHDAANNEIDIDVSDANLAIGSRYRPTIAVIDKVFSTGVVDNDPGTTKFKFNSATVGSITTLWIDPIDVGTVDTTVDLLSVISGDKMVVMNSTASTVYVTFTFSSAATDKTGYYQFTGTASGTLPSDLETCKVIYISKTALQAILKIDNFARFQSDGAGGYNIIDQNDAVVNGIVTTYALASNPVSGITELPAANTFTHGTEVRIHQDCFLGGSPNPMGVFAKADATNNLWRPSGGAQLMFSDIGTLTSPLATLSAAGRFAIASDPEIPGGLLACGALLLVMRVRKTGTNATAAVAKVFLGTDLVEANYANNSDVYQLTIATTSPFDINSNTLVTFPTTTTAFTNRNAATGGGGGGSLWIEKNTLINTASDMMVSFVMTVLTAPDTADLIGYEIWWVDRNF